jgi:hypothetical protein
MRRLRETRVPDGCNGWSVWHGRRLLHLYRRLRYNGSALFDRYDRTADLAFARAFFGGRCDDTEEQQRHERVNEKRRKITSRKPLTIATVPWIALCSHARG